MSKQTKDRAGDRPCLGSPERSSGERSETERSVGEPKHGRRATPLIAPADNETLERPQRRVFTAAYKLRILEEADAATEHGAIGELLRREGLYSSHLAAWRGNRELATHAGLTPKRRGPKPRRLTAEVQQLAQLQRENERLRHRLKQAETIIEFQKKLNDLLGIPLSSPPELGESSR